MSKKVKFCSDCIFFDSDCAELIDPKYPIIKRSWCAQLDKTVDNRWNTDCKKFKDKGLCTCESCIHFEDKELTDNDDDIFNDEGYCEQKRAYVNMNDSCMNYSDYFDTEN